MVYDPWYDGYVENSGLRAFESRLALAGVLVGSLGILSVALANHWLGPIYMDLIVIACKSDKYLQLCPLLNSAQKVPLKQGSTAQSLSRNQY